MHTCMQEGRQADGLECLASTISAPSRFASALASARSTVTFPMACFSASHLQSMPPQRSPAYPNAHCATLSEDRARERALRVSSGDSSTHPSRFQLQDNSTPARYPEQDKCFSILS